MTTTDPALPHVDPQCAAWLRATGLGSFALGGRQLLPIVQGGIGIGASANRLAGSVAALGGMGTISLVLRRHHPDLLERTRGLSPGIGARDVLNTTKLEALAREIAAARAGAGGRGLLAINVMRAFTAYAASVTLALQCGIDAVVVGAGLALDLPDLAPDHPAAVLIPIISDARRVQLLVCKWERKKAPARCHRDRAPRAGWRARGAARIADLHGPRFDFTNAIPQALSWLHSPGLEREVPLIAAGGMRSYQDIACLRSLGAAAVPLGTPFAVARESDAHPEFKRVLAQATDADRVQFTSVAGLPARAVGTRWLRACLGGVDRLQPRAHVKARCTKSFACLAQRGLRDGLAGWGQSGIGHHLAAALRGEVRKGLFFRRVGALPFGDQIRSMRDLMRRLLTPPTMPAQCAAA